MGILDPANGAGLGGGPGGTASSSLPGSPQPQSHFPMLDAMHKQAQARYAQTDKADKMMGMIRSGLDKLVSMGDAVTQDDVLDGMATLVAKGIDPKGLTSLMAGDPQTGAPPMPDGGPGLAAWLQQQDAVLTHQEAQLAPHVALTRHQMGVAAMHALVGHHVENGGTPPASEAPALAASTPQGTPNG